MLWGLFADPTLLNKSGFGRILIFQTTNIFTRWVWRQYVGQFGGQEIFRALNKRELNLLLRLSAWHLILFVISQVCKKGRIVRK